MAAAHLILSVVLMSLILQDSEAEPVLRTLIRRSAHVRLLDPVAQREDPYPPFNPAETRFEPVTNYGNPPDSPRRVAAETTPSFRSLGNPTQAPNQSPSSGTPMSQPAQPSNQAARRLPAGTSSFSPVHVPAVPDFNHRSSYASPSFGYGRSRTNKPDHRGDSHRRSRTHKPDHHGDSHHGDHHLVPGGFGPIVIFVEPPQPQPPSTTSGPTIPTEAPEEAGPDANTMMTQMMLQLMMTLLQNDQQQALPQPAAQPAANPAPQQAAAAGSSSEQTGGGGSD